MHEKIKNTSIIPFGIFYITGSLLIMIPFIFTKKSLILRSLFDIFSFKLSIISIIISFSAFILFLFISYTDNDEISFKKNLYAVQKIFGDRPNVYTVLFLSFAAGFFEEMLFKGYFYYLIHIIFKLNGLHIINIILISVISLIFGIFHLSQGIKGFIYSVILSIVFFITFILSKSIWYAVITHSLYNFTEIMLVIPSVKEKFKIRLIHNKKA